MALEGQFGGDSLLYLGFPTSKTAPVNTGPETSPPVAYDDASDAAKGIGRMVRGRFPFTELGVDLGSEQAESASITGRSASSKRAGGQLWSEGPIEMEILPNQIIHFLRPSFNRDPAESAKIDAPFTLNTRLAKPSKLTISDDDLGTPSAGKTVTVIGNRRIGLPDDEVRVLKEEVPFTAAGDITTTKYFDSLRDVLDVDGTSILSSNALPASTTVTADTDTYSTSLTGFGPGLSDGVTTLMRKGLMPVLATHVWFNNTVITLGDDLRMRIEGLGDKIFNRRAPGSTDFDLRKLPAGWLDDTNYPIGNLDFSPSWGGVFMFGDRIVECTGLTMGLNLNLEQRRSYKGSRFRGRPRRSNTPRQITLSPSVFFEYEDDANEVFDDWQDIYIDNATRAASFNMYNWLDNGKEYAIKCTFPNLQLTEVPSIAVDTQGDIERTLAFLGIPTASNPSNELQVVVEADQYMV